MSLVKISVCRLILKEHFGELAEKVGLHLMKKGSTPLKLIAMETSLKLDEIRKVLTILMQQNLLSYETSKRGFIEYNIDVEMLLWRLRFPRYIYNAKALYGDGAELLVEELLHQGQALMSTIVESVTTKLNEALDAAGHTNISRKAVYEKFCSLAETHFIQHAENPTATHGDREDLNTDRNMQLYKVPPMEVDGDSKGKRKRSMDDSEQPSKKQKMEGGADSKPSDDGIFWRVSHHRFHQHLRDQAMIAAITSKIDQKAAAVLQTMLRLSEVRTGDLAVTTNSLSLTEIHQAMPPEQRLTRNLMEQYLSILADDSTDFVSKVGESGGGMFVVNIYKALTSLCKAHLESVVQERFGSKCLRIFRVLLVKKHLEQKQIEEYAMIPAKEAKDLLYNMFAQNFVSITEVSKTPDHAPSRTFYLFKVDVIQLSRMLLDNCYKALCNAMLKREAELKEHRRLMDKQERVAAIIASLEQNGADDTQKEEIQQTITPSEKSQLTKVKHTVDMLDRSEIQLDETIFILETFLYYTDQKSKLKL